MPINQPPIKEKPEEAAWDFELVALVNQLESRVNTLLKLIGDADNLDELKELIRRL